MATLRTIYNNLQKQIDTNLEEQALLGSLLLRSTDPIEREIIAELTAQSFCPLAARRSDNSRLSSPDSTSK